MAYMNQERKRIISEALKPVLRKYGMKGILSVRNHSTIVLNLKSGKIDFRKYFARKDVEYDANSYHMDINPYWYHEYYTGVAKDFLAETFTALKSANWYDRSDAMVDYFDTAYYVDVNVGSWSKPYVVAE